MMVLDTSAVIELLLRTTRGQAVEVLLENPAETLHAPQLIDVETTQVLRRLVREGHLSGKRAATALDTYMMLGVARYDHAPLLKRMWALRDRLTAYDASYVALAEVLDAPLITFDARIAKAKHGAKVVLPSS